MIINYNKSEEEALKLQSELSNSICVKADVSVESDVKKMIEFCTENCGFIDVLVNNAGIAQQKLFTDISSGEWEKMIATNLNSVYYTCKYVIPYMVREKCGKIINISSMWGVTGGSCEVHYSASKAGVIGFTKALAKELAPSNINVNAVAPGTVATDMCGGFDEETIEMIKEETPAGRLGTPDDIAETVLFLAGKGADYITGQVIGVNGGMVI